MIAMLKGTVLEKNDNEAILMTSAGIAFSVLCSVNTLSRLPSADEECRLYTFLNVREDGVELYGFLTREERDFFRRLTGVNGIGPKTALGILGSMSLSDLRMAVLTEDAAALSRAPGIGKKTAQRIVLELKDKIAQDAMSAGLAVEDIPTIPSADAPAQDAVGEAILALKTLGYTPQEAIGAIKAVKNQAESADELIKLALRHMAQNA